MRRRSRELSRWPIKDPMYKLHGVPLSLEKVIHRAG